MIRHKPAQNYEGRKRGQVWTPKQLKVKLGGAGWIRIAGHAVGYRHRDTGKVIDLDEVQIDGRKLVDHLCESGILPSKKL